jgi:hypothetical protein
MKKQDSPSCATSKKDKPFPSALHPPCQKPEIDLEYLKPDGAGKITLVYLKHRGLFGINSVSYSWKDTTIFIGLETKVAPEHGLNEKK